MNKVLTLTNKKSTALSSATQHAMPRNSSGKWGKESHKDRFSWERTWITYTKKGLGIRKKQSSFTAFYPYFQFQLISHFLIHAIPLTDFILETNSEYETHSVIHFTATVSFAAVNHGGKVCYRTWLILNMGMLFLSNSIVSTPLQFIIYLFSFSRAHGALSFHVITKCYIFWCKCTRI